MRTLRHPVFIVSILLFCLNQALEYEQVYFWPLYTHLDDLLCLPVTLTIILTAERIYFRNPYILLPWHYLFISVLLFSLVFEVVLPMLETKFTSDAWDVVAYILGACIFHASINRVILPKCKSAVKF